MFRAYAEYKQLTTGLTYWAFDHDEVGDGQNTVLMLRTPGQEPVLAAHLNFEDFEMLPRVYKLEHWAMSGLLDLVAKYDKKAAKVGAKPLEFNIEVKSSMVTDQDLNSFSYGQLVEHKWIEVSFKGAPLKINGWEFQGTIQHTDGGNILRSVPGREMAEKWRSVVATCAHCNTKRDRKDSFVLSNENGLDMQIGRNCLRDFLGHDPSMALAFLDDVRDLAGMSEEESTRGGGKRMVHVTELLSMVAAIVTKTSWSKSTPDVAWNYLFASTDLKKAIREGKAPSFEPSAESEALAQRALAWIETAQGSSFISNVKVAVKMTYISEREMKLASWAIGAYINEMEREKTLKAKLEAEQAERAASTSVHLGQIGERLVMTAEIVDERQITLQDTLDTMNIFKLKDAAGNVITWFTGTRITENVEQKLEDGTVYWTPKHYGVGDKITFKATIKKHTEYKGVKETGVSRLSLHVEKPKKARKKKEANA